MPPRERERERINKEDRMKRYICPCGTRLAECRGCPVSQLAALVVCEILFSQLDLLLKRPGKLSGCERIHARNTFQFSHYFFFLFLNTFEENSAWKNSPEHFIYSFTLGIQWFLFLAIFFFFNFPSTITYFFKVFL